VWCSVLPCVAVCCSVLQCVVCQRVANRRVFSVLQCGAVCRRVVQCGASSARRASTSSQSSCVAVLPDSTS